jgi:type I restriction enzyme M protein
VLRNRQLAGLKFRRQHQMGEYIVDFYCHDLRLVVELYGDVNQTPVQAKKDIKRQRYLGSIGCKVLVFQNDDVYSSIEQVLEKIVDLIPSPNGRGTQGEGSLERYNTQDKVLMIDARNIYRKVTRKIYDFSPEQLKNITAIVWLYRDQTDRYLALVKEYLKSIVQQCIPISDKLKSFETSLDALKTNIDAFVSNNVKSNGQDKEKRKLFTETITEWSEAETLYKKDKKSMLQNVDDFQKKYGNSIPGTNAAQIKAQEAFTPIAEKIKGLIKQIDLLCKLAVKSADIIEKDLNGKHEDQWNSREVSKQKKEFDLIRKDTVEQLKLSAYFHKQAHWLQSRFPDAKLADVEGLVKLVDRKEIAKNDWSLTPGRYVGVAPVEEDEDFDFEETLRDIHTELADLNHEAAQLAVTIQKNFEELGI